MILKLHCWGDPLLFMQVYNKLMKKLFKIVGDNK